MHCAVRRPYPLLTWVAIPVLFTAAVLGLTSLGQLLLGTTGDTVVTSAHLGGAAALTAILGYSIEWPERWQWARWPYPVVVFLTGIVVHGQVVPIGVALVAGLLAVTVLVRFAWRHRFLRRRKSLVSG